MKIKYAVLIYTIIVAVFYLLSAPRLWTDIANGENMVNINQIYKQIENDLKQNKDTAGLAQQYGCEILLMDNSDYESLLMQYISEGKIILDLKTGNQLWGKVIFAGRAEAYRQLQRQLQQNLSLAYILLLLAGYTILFIIYRKYMRPFYKLQYFALEVARGNLDTPLGMEKEDYFGAFTESFDIMRAELKSAREKEFLANISKKELVAGLSHDMKTPLAAIKATCEVMQLKEKGADTLEKVQVIATKAEMIDNLINNMFQATLEELEVLSVDSVETASNQIMEMFWNLQYYGSLEIVNGIPACLVFMDPLRLNQVIDNIINNAYKYGGNKTVISFEEVENTIRITIRDNGTGVPEEELPLITQKFYRGSNVAGKSGSGLGLYLSKTFMESMGGGLECYNQDGFVVNLYLKKV